MDQTRARELQEKLALEAAAMLSLAGSGAETAPYEQAVSLIGKAWRLTAEETSEQLALIEQEKAVMGRIENGESAEHIRQELLLNWSGLESIEVLEGLVPFPVSWTVKMKKKQKETQDILSYHSQAAGCSDKTRAKASGGRQPIEECGRTGL